LQQRRGCGNADGHETHEKQRMALRHDDPNLNEDHDADRRDLSTDHVPTASLR
jgi:hypothetical protein